MASSYTPSGWTPRNTRPSKCPQARRQDNGSVTAETTVSECARPRAQPAPNVLTRRISLYLCRFPTLLRPRTGALRHDLLPLSLTHLEWNPCCGRLVSVYIRSPARFQDLVFHLLVIPQDSFSTNLSINICRFARLASSPISLKPFRKPVTPNPHPSNQPPSR